MKAYVDMKATIIGIIAKIFIFSRNSRRTLIEIYKFNHIFTHIL